MTHCLFQVKITGATGVIGSPAQLRVVRELWKGPGAVPYPTLDASVTPRNRQIAIWRSAQVMSQLLMILKDQVYDSMQMLCYFMYLLNNAQHSS